MKGNLIVVSGPSGVGKGTLCAHAIEKTGAVFSISATTRKPREGEVDGKDYFFLSEEEFRSNIEKNAFVEYVHNYGKSYGTLKTEVQAKLDAGLDILFDIDVAGGKSIKAQFPEAILVFVIPPSLSDLEKRLDNRGSETTEQKAVRLAGAMTEIEAIPFYEYCIVNDDVDEARKCLESIINDGRTGTEKAEGLRLNPEEAKKIVKRFKEEKNALSGN